jgi:hypothetical protein
MRRKLFLSLALSLCLSGTSSGTAGFAAPAPSPSATQWNQIAEESEHAFTVEIPSNFVIQSGVARRPGTAMGLPWFNTTSPDGKTTIFLGTPANSYFTLPGRFMQDGQTRPIPTGQLICSHFLTGQEYVCKYGPSLLPAGATNIVMQSAQDEPEWTAKVQNFIGTNTGAKVSVGSAKFTFMLNSEAKSETIAIQTMLSPGPNPAFPGNWSVVNMWGCCTKPGEESNALAMAEHVRHSFKIDHQWGDRQLAAIQQAGARGMAMLQQMNQVQNAALRQQAASNQAMLNASHQAGMERMQTQGNIANMRAQAQSDWHSHQMVNHFAQMAAKDNNNYHEVLMIQNKHLEWDPTVHGNVEVPNY